MPRPLLALVLAAGCARSAPNSAATAPAAPADADCPRRSIFAPVELPMAEYRARTDPGVTRFSERPTSVEAPLETCMVNGQLRLLTRLTCDDGSNPFAGDGAAAHDARAGSVGPGGRCGSIVDLYVVPCPEQQYKVYIDMYVCPEGGR